MTRGFVVEASPGRYMTHTYFWYRGHPGIHAAWVHQPEALKALFFSRTTNLATWDEVPQRVFPAMFDGRQTIVTGDPMPFDTFLASLARE